MSTEKTWMSADQFADVLELYAACREPYVDPVHREMEAWPWDAPLTAQLTLQEVEAYRNAARILRHMDETPIGCHTAMLGVWERGVDAIKHGDKPVTRLT